MFLCRWLNSLLTITRMQYQYTSLIGHLHLQRSFQHMSLSVLLHGNVLVQKKVLHEVMHDALCDRTHYLYSTKIFFI